MNQNNFWEKDIKSNQRFRFGKNWLNYSRSITEKKIKDAEVSIKLLLGLDSLQNKTFIDIGCGSGIMSLAARRLGAKVYSFDFDKDSVNCTKKIKAKYFPDDSKWFIGEGSVLDKNFLMKLGTWDIVYSWGVLHHTGNMWLALENVLLPLKESNGLLFISIYNDEGTISKIWRKIKKFYVSSTSNEIIIKLFCLPTFIFSYLLLGLIKNLNPLYYFKATKKNVRGMSIYFDLIDWLGGYPFEVAKPEKIINFYKSKGLNLKNLKTTNRLGCNEYVFEN